MRILLDKRVPRPLQRELSGHEVRPVVEMGWAGKRKGALLWLLTVEHFAVFLTTDQNLRYQQNLPGLQVAVVVLAAPTDGPANLVPLIPAVCARWRPECAPELRL